MANNEKPNEPTSEQAPREESGAEQAIGKAASVAARILLPNVLTSHPDLTSINNPIDRRISTILRDVTTMLEGAGLAIVAHPTGHTAGVLLYTFGRTMSITNDALARSALRKQSGK